MFYFTLSNRLSRDKEMELSSIMQIKKNQVVNWREERKSETRYFVNNTSFIDEFFQYTRNSTQEARKALSDRLLVVQRNHYYRIILVSLSGQELLSVGNGGYWEFNKSKIDSTVNLRKDWIDDIKLDNETGFIHLDLYAPLIKSINNRDSVFAVMLFVIDPNKDLFPIVSTWPVKSESAEALLIKEEGENVITLLKSNKNSALSYKVPIHIDQSPSVKAVKGYNGVFEGIDYRQVKVIAAAGNIPGTNWYLMTKIDYSEVYKPLYLYSAFIVAIVIALLIASGTSIALFARKREIAAVQKQYQLEQEKLALKEHYEYLIKNANDIILLMDYHGKIIDVNDKAISEYEYTKDELLSMNISQLRSPEIRDYIKSLTSDSNEEGLIYESVHRKKNGDDLNVEVSSRIIKVNNRKYIQYIIRDISERKINEAKIRRLNRVYELLSQIDEAIIRESDAKQLFRKICTISIETGHFIAVGIGIFNKKTLLLDIIDSAGLSKSYFNNLEISPKDGDVGILLWEGKYFIFNNIENNPSIELGRNDALEKEYKSVGYFPLLKESKTFGAIIFYSAEREFFDEEEIRLLSEVANNLSFALDTIEQERQKLATEDALHKTELNLKTLARSIPKTSIYIYNRELDILLAEGTSLDNTDIKPTQLIQGEIAGLHLINIKQKIQEVFSDRVYSNEVIIGENVYLIQLHPVKNDSGDIIAGMIVLQNITENKKYESALLESESRLRGFFNLNNVYMALIEMKIDDISIVMANRKLAEFYNMGTDELKNKSIRELEGEEFFNYWVDIYRNINKYKRPVSIEFSIHRGEKTFWFVAEISLIEPVLAGNPLYSYTAFDITERKMFENDLRKSEERFRSFFESDVIGVAYGDIYGNIQYSNNKYLNIIGYSREDFNKGKVNWRALTPPEYYELDQVKIKEAKEKGACENYEKELIKKDGTRVKILLGFVISGEKKEEIAAFIHKLS